jgi:hypothetical protein
MIGCTLRLAPVCTLLLVLTEAGGDPGVFCYRMGVDILSVDSGRFLAPVNVMAGLAKRTFAISKRKNQVACSNLFSTLSARCSTPKD